MRPELGEHTKRIRTLGLRLNIWHWHDLLHSTHNSEEERAIADGNPLQTIIVRLAGEGPGSKCGANCRIIRLVTRHESSPRTYLLVGLRTTYLEAVCCRYKRNYITQKMQMISSALELRMLCRDRIHGPPMQIGSQCRNQI